METEIQYISALGVAKKLGVSRSWVLRKVQAKIIPHIRIGGVIRFSERELETWINNHKIKGVLKI